MRRFRYWKQLKSTDRLRIYAFLFILTLAALSSTSALLISPDWDGLLLNFGTEMIGSSITFIVIDWIIEKRLELEATQKEARREKLHLIKELRSRNNRRALYAVDELRAKGWITNGMLRRKYLANADLQNAILHSADLRQANLDSANMTKAILRSAQLGHAFLHNANLQQADLTAADLESSLLISAILRSAKLSRTNLRYANLLNADLEGADLTGSDLYQATLPNGSIWYEGMNIDQFTNPKPDDF
ncbi:MAG: pentapeptide repeat-containing protein [Anaerolineae bacterium]|nr:pentapeptide repeat-containing protein [Anaerolineae bacterium]